MESDKFIFIYEELEKKQCTVLSSEKLWVKWFELELENHKENIFSSQEDYYFVMMLKLSACMMLLGLKLSKINHIILQFIAPNYLKKDSKVLVKELEESLEKQSKFVLKGFK